MGQSEIRDREGKDIVNSDKSRIVVVAGPGCGKSWTFRKFLEAREANTSNSLAITFINELTNDLRENLSDISEVRTFHSLAQKLLRKYPVTRFGLKPDFLVYQDLPILIERDYLEYSGGNSSGDMVEQMRSMSINADEIQFFLDRCEYYNAASHDDLAYRVVLARSKGLINPIKYNQIVVDEFQDFNALDVRFIEDVLIPQNALLIAGDDDQAIYDFLSAKPDYLRERAKSGSPYTKYPLTYCSRCTSVVVDAVKNIIAVASQRGLLKERINKPFECYMPSKKDASEQHPKIFHVKCSTYTPKSPYISEYIQMILDEIAPEEISMAKEGKYPPALIIGNTQYIEHIARELSGKGYKVVTKQKNNNINLEKIFFAFSILANDHDSNLAWRIIIEYLDGDISELIRLSLNSNFSDIIDQKIKVKWLEAVKIYQKLVSDSISDEERSNFLKVLADMTNLSIEDINFYLSNKFRDSEKDGQIDDNNLWIKLTTHFGSKGLSAGRVFIVGFNNGDFPKNPENITDKDLCHLLIDITRTRLECHLISNGMFMKPPFLKPSIYLEFIGNENVETRVIDKDIVSRYRASRT